MRIKILLVIAVMLFRSFAGGQEIVNIYIGCGWLPMAVTVQVCDARMLHRAAASPGNKK